MSEQLPARLEATALMRQVQSEGGFATILKHGDDDRGALTLLIAQRGLPKALIERRMGPDFQYRWALIMEADGSDAEKFRESTEKLRRQDPDCWLIELDVADAERFVAETIAWP